MARYRRFFFLLPALILLASVLSATLPWTHPSEASSPQAPGIAQLSGELRMLAAPPPAEAFPIAELDTCLHCHLTGELTNLWTPLTRWLVFGAFGMVFVYGAARSASAWRTRTPWKQIGREHV